jgi:hypothetical protein
MQIYGQIAESLIITMISWGVHGQVVKVIDFKPLSPL